jgi:hypothetical protein
MKDNRLIASLDRLWTRARALAAARSYTLSALGSIPGVALYCVAREHTQEGTRVRVMESLNKQTIIAIRTGFFGGDTGRRVEREKKDTRSYMLI